MSTFAKSGATCRYVMGPEDLITYISAHFSGGLEAQQKERRGCKAKN